MSATATTGSPSPPSSPRKKPVLRVDTKRRPVSTPGTPSVLSAMDKDDDNHKTGSKTPTVDKMSTPVSPITAPSAPTITTATTTAASEFVDEDDSKYVHIQDRSYGQSTCRYCGKPLDDPHGCYNDETKTRRSRKPKTSSSLSATQSNYFGTKSPPSSPSSSEADDDDTTWCSQAQWWISSLAHTFSFYLYSSPSPAPAGVGAAVSVPNSTIQSSPLGCRVVSYPSSKDVCKDSSVQRGLFGSAHADGSGSHSSFSRSSHSVQQHSSVLHHPPQPQLPLLSQTLPSSHLHTD